MCLVAFAIDQSRRFPLVVASNRDEFHARPSAELAWWSTGPHGPRVLGGRDLASGGTWLGLTEGGRLALLTNVRSATPPDPAAPTRGRIVTDWLSGSEQTGDFWMRTALSGHNGFNLVAADFACGEGFWASNQFDGPRRLEHGLHGLSNGSLDAPWPKVRSLKAALRTALGEARDVGRLATLLFAALADRHLAIDAELPATGIPIERERQLSPTFIHMPEHGYGTRCSTVIVTERTARQLVTHVFERSFDPGGNESGFRRASLRNWPPRHAAKHPGPPVEADAVVDLRSEQAPLAIIPPPALLTPPAEPRRTRTANLGT